MLPRRSNPGPAALIVLAVLVALQGCARPPADGCSGTVVQLRRPETLTVGVDLSYAPFAFEDPDTGDPAGFEVDLAGAVAKKMGLELSLQSRTSAALIPGVLAHRHDLAASGLRDDERLRAEVCVSAPYLDADLGILVRRDNPLGIDGEGDLAGRTVGVVQGSEAEAWSLERLGETSSVRRYATPEDLLAGLPEGEIDAAVEDLPVARHVQTVTPELEVVHIVDRDSRYVFATAPDNGGLMRLVDDALRELRRDRTLPDLRKRWFSGRS